MPDYLPLCAFRQGLLPAACRTCAWWQTTGNERLSPEEATERRRQWMSALESTWGPTGLLLQGPDQAPSAAPAAGRTGGAPDPVIVASVSFAPAAAIPRLRSLPFISLPAGSAFLFCPTLAEGQPRALAKRTLHKALGELRARGVLEAYALATPSGETAAEVPTSGHSCGFFSLGFLAASGFQQVMENGDLVLMRVDLRGLLSLIGQVKTAVKRVLRNEPAPSPVTWTRRGT